MNIRRIRVVGRLAHNLVLRNEKMITVSYEDQVPDAREVAARLGDGLRPRELPLIDDVGVAE